MQQHWGSDSRPVLLKCSDNKNYVVKALQSAKSAMEKVLTNEQVVGRLGCAIAAPVGEVKLVDVPADLVSAEPDLQHMQPGIAHGCLYLGDNMGRRAIEYVHVPENRPRFASLAVLFGWVGSGDDQFLYATTPPEIVYSVDHGHFLGPGGPEWDILYFQRAGPSAAPNQQLVAACGLTEDELRAAAMPLKGITDQAVRDIVAIPPAAWGIRESERDELVRYLCRRRDEVIQATGA